MSYKDAGAFLPTTNIWDVTEIYSTEVTSPEFKELLVRLYQNLNNMSMMINVKDSAIYTTDEFVCGQTYFSNPNLNSTTTTAPTQRQVYRKIINSFDATATPKAYTPLPNAAGLITFPHGLTITTGYSFTRIYGVTSDPVNKIYLPLPYASGVLVEGTPNVATDVIELSVDDTNVNITVGKDRSAFTMTYIVLEYIKQ